MLLGKYMIQLLKLSSFIVLLEQNIFLRYSNRLLVEQELLTLLKFAPGFDGVRATRSLVLYVCFVDRCLSYCHFLLAISLSVLRRFAGSDYLFGIVKVFIIDAKT